jgi:excisionase family DNA binding protein
MIDSGFPHEHGESPWRSPTTSMPLRHCSPPPRWPSSFNPKTVTRWARAGKLTAIRTLGGHRRFRASEIKRCLEEMSVEEH